VRRLELFGSAVGDGFDPQRSDMDFLVEFEPLTEGQHADMYFGLRESLGSLFSRPVDLVMTRAIRNRYFLEAIEPTRTLLYAA
jgi:predicted nucleotidyltransferase